MRGVYGNRRPAPPSPAIATVPVGTEYAKVAAVTLIGALMLTSAIKVWRAASHDFFEISKRTRKW